MRGFIESFIYNAQHPLVFNSVFFFILFTVFYAFYTVSFNHVKLRNVFLLVFSLYFYYKVSGLFVVMLILMATSDYFIGIWLYYVNSHLFKRLLVGLSLVINLGYLSYFKYANFLVDSFHGLTNNPTAIRAEMILLPIGMSYFVFKTLSYIFDLYREVIEEPEENYINYLLYVSFFPNILAGPISKARDLLPQIKRKLDISEEYIGLGFFLILSGAFKKVFLSDFIAVNFVDRVFTSPNLFTGFENLMASYGATIQIYCDFSGYTDMVIGIAYLLGFAIEPNFRKPFLAQNITEFWRRWHMTLSNWMNEYLFFPLSYGFRHWRKVGVLLAVLLTFFISGLWHGPNWTFILWGILHGLAISWDVLTQSLRAKIRAKVPAKLYQITSIFLTLNFLTFSIVLFKSPDLAHAGEVYHMIFNYLDFSVFPQWINLYFWPFIVIVLAYTLHYLPEQLNTKLIQTYIKLPWLFKALLASIIILLIYQAFNAESQPFVYLDF